MAGSKSTQTRDNRIYYTSPRLLFSTTVHLLIMVDVFVDCGMWEIFVQVVPQLSRWFGFISLIQSHYYWLFLYPSKSKRRDVQQMRLSLVCVLFDPAIPTSFFNFVFILVSVLFYCTQCNLSMPSYGLLTTSEDGRCAKFFATPLINLRS